jgi:hypothetical protein
VLEVRAVRRLEPAPGAVAPVAPVRAAEDVAHLVHGPLDHAVGPPLAHQPSPGIVIEGPRATDHVDHGGDLVVATPVIGHGPEVAGHHAGFRLPGAPLDRPARLVAPPRHPHSPGQRPRRLQPHPVALEPLGRRVLEPARPAVVERRDLAQRVELDTLPRAQRALDQGTDSVGGVPALLISVVFG